MSRPDLATRVLARLLRHRALVIVIYALVVPIAAVLALRIPTEASIDRLIVPSDPDYVATRAFHRLFPEPDLVLLVFESSDPWAPAALARLEAAKAALAQVPHVTAFSVVDALRRVRPGADPATLRRLATGTPYFRQEGLLGDHFLTLITHLDVHSAAERDAALAAIDHALCCARIGPVRKIGTPYVNAWLEHAAAAATTRSFAIFAVLLLVVTLFLYRSARALLAIVLALGSAVTLALAAGALLGFTFTIVSALVPLAVMLTTLATLTYLHSRFVDQPEDLPLVEHHLAALRNKVLPVTASTVAAASGFAALALSNIRPIREMGIWTAVGLVLALVVAYTLFPALQRALRTPTTRRVAIRTAMFDRLARLLPRITYRRRKGLLGIALALSIAGVLAITGIPGLFGGLPVEVEGLANIDRSTALYRDTRWFQTHVVGHGVVHVWIHLPGPTATDPEVLRAIDHLETALAATPGITAVTGPTTALRLRRYLAGRPEALPRDPEAFASAVADVEELLLTQPDLRGFIDPNGLADLQITVMFRQGPGGYGAEERRIQAAWDATRAAFPAVARARVHVVGAGLIEAKVGENLVPTLAESFALTVVLILAVFLLIFRSGTERLLAMIPSVFALLVTFLGLRVFGGSLNVATIIIATTVLGTTENDQMHFFHHMHERNGAPLEVRLHHTLHVAGRAVLFATVINAVGFFGLATSSFPPLRQFGLMTAAAFGLALVADLTLLPAALWLASGERPAPEAGGEGDPRET